MRRMLILTILSLSLLSLPVFADQLTLKNGDRLSGTIVKSDDDAKTLLIKTDLAGDVTIKWDAITAIVSSQPLHIMLSDGRVIVGRVSTTDGVLEIASDDGTVPAAHDAVKAIRDNATQAEIDRLQHPGVRDEFNLNPRVYAFAFTDFDEDALQHLDLRNVLGGGLGYHIINTKKTQFDGFGGASFNQEYFASYTIANPAPPPVLLFEPSQSRHSAEIVAGESLSTKLGPRTIVSEQLSFFPNLSSTGEYRVTFDANAVTKLKTWLGWQITLSDRYISDPPFGLKGNDLLLSTGLRLTFGKGIF